MRYSYPNHHPEPYSQPKACHSCSCCSTRLTILVIVDFSPFLRRTGRSRQMNGRVLKRLLRGDHSGRGRVLGQDWQIAVQAPVIWASLFNVGLGITVIEAYLVLR